MDVLIGPLKKDFLIFFLSIEFNQPFNSETPTENWIIEYIDYYLIAELKSPGKEKSLRKQK